MIAWATAAALVSLGKFCPVLIRNCVHAILTSLDSFESRDICEEVIQTYHGQSIGEEGFLMQVRYADTPAQKELKRITAERRQYRTNEYNIGAYGTMAVGINPSIYSTQTNWGRSPRFARYIPSPSTSYESRCWQMGYLTSHCSANVAMDGGNYRPVLAAKSGNANTANGRERTKYSDKYDDRYAWRYT